MKYSHAAKLCRVSYWTIRRLCRNHKLSTFKRLNVYQVDNSKIIKILDSNMILGPGITKPDLVKDKLCTIGEAAKELDISYRKFYRMQHHFTRTSFFGKTLIVKRDLKVCRDREYSNSHEQIDNERAEHGLRM